MSNVAFLYGDIIVYWNYIIAGLGLIAGCIFAFVFRPYTLVKRKTVVLWLILAIIFSFAFSRMLYFYCKTEQYFSWKEALTNVFDNRYSVVGLVLGVLLAALIAGFFSKQKCVRKLLDTTFPGVLLALSLIRLSYYYTDTYHSNISIENEIFRRLPFAVSSTDAAGNTSFVFAPFFISAIILFLTVLVIALFIRKKLRRTGELFLLTFVFFALSEMVLEGTRQDALRLHFIALKSLNKYVSFICFSMFALGIILLIMFIVNYRRAVKYTGSGNNIAWLILFVFSFICFGTCEYLVQRYTAQEVLFHWLQAGFALLMAISMVVVIHRRRQKNRRSLS